MNYTDKKVFGLILAGGSGSRLWPLSRELFPKQLLKICNNDEYSLFQQTVKLMLQLVDKNNLFTVTNNKLESDLKIQFNETLSKQNLDDSPFIIEPIGRNTAPAIATSTMFILKKCSSDNDDPIIIVTPADHLIKDTEKYIQYLKEAIDLASQGLIVTLGIIPDRPHNGYGYIKAIIDNNSNNYFQVEKFVEKPEIELAKQFLKEGNFFWNSGVFIFKASTLINEIELHNPDFFDILNKINYNDKNFEYEEYKNLPDISIDYAIMEKTKKLLVIPIDSGWSDMGNWSFVFENSEKDSNDNFITGNVLDLDCNNNLIYSSDRLLATIGITDTVIVNTEDATLICKQDEAHKVKDIYKLLKDREDNTYKFHRTRLRPWGYSTLLQEGENFKIQSVCIKPNCSSSLHMHYHKNKLWTIVRGVAQIYKNGEVILLNPGDTTTIKATEKHKVSNPGKIDLMIIEVQTGSYLEDNDIVRFKEECVEVI